MSDESNRLDFIQSPGESDWGKSNKGATMFRPPIIVNNPCIWTHGVPKCKEEKTGYRVLLHRLAGRKRPCLWDVGLNTI